MDYLEIVPSHAECLDNFVKRPVPDKLTERIKTDEENLKKLLEQNKLDSIDLNFNELEKFLFEKNIVGPKLNMSLLTAFVDYKASKTAEFYHNSSRLFQNNFLQFREYYKSITNLESIFNLFAIIYTIEKVIILFDLYDINALDNINDNEQAYLLWHTFLKPQTLKKPLNHQFFKDTVYDALKRLCHLAKFNIEVLR